MPEPRVRFEPLRLFIATALERLGLPPADAAIVGTLMAQAELQGSDGHGVIRLLPYARRIRAGGINLKPDIRVVQERALADKWGQSLGQTFTVDNKPGAGGNIGADFVAKSPPDGSTLVIGTVGTHAINASLYDKMPYHHVKDFTPITFLASTPNLLVVNKNVPATTSRS